MKTIASTIVMLFAVSAFANPTAPAAGTTTGTTGAAATTAPAAGTTGTATATTTGDTMKHAAKTECKGLKGAEHKKCMDEHKATK